MTASARWHVYLDSNFFIRFVESQDDALLQMIEKASSGLVTLHTSELTLAEVLVDPIRSGDDTRRAAFVDLLNDDALLDLLPVSREILIGSAQVRATIGNKLPNAIHVATALASGCNVVLSSDKRLRVPARLTRVRLEDTGNMHLWP